MEEVEHAQNRDAGNLAKDLSPWVFGFSTLDEEAGFVQGSALRRLPGVLNGILINFLQCVGLELGERCLGSGVLPSEHCPVTLFR